MSITDEINLLSRDVFVDRVPHDWFTWLRNNAPVYHHSEPDGPGFWVITKYDDVVHVGKDAKTYSSDQGRGGVVLIEEPPPGMSNDLGSEGKLMLTTDPPEHTRYRKLVNRGFTPRMIGALEKHIREQAADIIDKAIQGRRRVASIAATVSCSHAERIGCRWRAGQGSSGATRMIAAISRSASRVKRRMGESIELCTPRLWPTSGGPSPRTTS